MPRKRTSNVMKRLSTLRYEIAKDMTPEPLHETELRNTLLNQNGLCLYCSKNRVSNGFGDIFTQYRGEIS